ncbi:hypothetical protein Y032_0501g2606 [Ancylostoma ceylanicum]|uniref:Uncharacterized protein n=1 Tax=Ancylostoma ceylanicum TaxID=53326 RepID=A0A016WV97_9BILA|nr:hypothetical protein Y032_0501g2606 [Ancylostoma ceylanicum]
MIYVLETRLKEARSKTSKVAQKLGVNQEKSETNTSTTSENALLRGNTDNLGSDDTEREFSPNDAAWLSEDVSETGLVDREDIICKTLKPQQLKLPRFFGDEGEFSEFWAVFESLVHENKVLSTIEKLLLLRDSLKGKAELAIKGIQLVPKNYPWMINALKKKYGNKPINRAKVVQKLVDLRPAANNAESCTFVYDKIRVLINQMVSAGQDVRRMQDALWTEKILEKFPYSIVKNVLIATQEMDEIKIDDIKDAPEKQIEAKKYVESRLRNFTKSDNPKKRSDNIQREFATINRKSCVFRKAPNHESINCKTVNDVQARRNLRHSRDKSRGEAQFKRHDTCASIPKGGGVLARACALSALAAALRARAAAPAGPICLRLSRFQPASMG